MHLKLSTLSLALLGGLLFCNDLVSATPAKARTTKKTTATSTTPSSTPTPKLLHGCRTVVQRWGLDSWETFDTMYESDGKEVWNQATIGSTTPGDELVPYQLGSNILHIYNTANPVYEGLPPGTADPGKLSFVWGDQKWDNFSPGTPCTSMASPAGVNSTCTFLCDR